MQMKDETAIITGSTSGIGKKIAELFLKEGCKVTICSRDKDRVANTVKEFKEKFNVGDLVTCDSWKFANRLGSTDFAKIVFIGDEEFCIEDEDGLTVCYISEDDWQHRKEPTRVIKIHWDFTDGMR